MNEETVLDSEIQTDLSSEPATEPVQTDTVTSDSELVTEPSSAPDSVSETIPEESSLEKPSEEGSENLEVTEATIYEDFSGSENVEYTAATEAVNVFEVIETVGSDLAHVNLFGSFLICGTLVGMALLRNIHGT